VSAPVPSPVRLAGARRVIAQRMVQSLAASAQLTYHTDADITDLMARRAAWKARGAKMSVEDCAIAALAGALAAQPQFNGTLQEDVLTLSESVDVSIAISTGGALLTPVVRNAERLGLAELAAARADLVSRARSGTLKVSEMKGGSTTLSNLGLTAVRHFTPILNGGQLTLLGLGRIEPRLSRDVDGKLRERLTLGLSLTADHRVIDGEPAGRLLGDICDRLATLDLDA
jgi:pyruvate/2-oxoglutarate dehydrogenase complex dihydrolipoamide acyltransferase (E2) component